MPAQDFSNHVLIYVEGQQLPADVASMLVGCVVDNDMGAPDLFLLRFRDPDNAVLTKTNASIGSKVKVSIASNENRTPVVLTEGEVTALEKELDGTGTYTIVRGLDSSHRLQRGRRVKVFANMSISDVVRKVAQTAGLAPGSIDASQPVYDQISQGNLTDWEFLKRLAADVGYRLAISNGKLDFKKPAAASGAPPTSVDATTNALVLEMGRNLLRLRVLMTSAEQVPSVQVRGWDTKTKRAVVGTAAAATTTVQIGKTPVALAQQFSAPPLVVTDAPYTTQPEVNNVAKATAEQVAGGFAELECHIRGNAQVRAGTAITLAGVGQPFEGKYTVSASRHVLDPDAGYTTRVTVSNGQDRSLYGVANGGGSARPSGAHWRETGVAIALVTDSKDPLKLGRVKLKFPWLDDTYVTDWARTMHLGAGATRGLMILPEVNDEVLVAFEHGDFGRPYVIGGLYNGVDKPVVGTVTDIDSGTGAVDRRALVTRTGHKLEFVESTAAKAIHLATGDQKFKLTLDQTGTTIIVNSDGTVAITGSKGVTVDSGTGVLALKGQKITLDAQTDIEVKASANLKMSATAQAELKGTAGVKVEGAQVSVNGQARTEIKAGAMVQVQAALVKIN